MDRDEHWQRFNQAQQRSSDVFRQFGFAGIAAIWVFRTSEDLSLLPVPLANALTFMVLALAADFLEQILLPFLWVGLLFGADKLVERGYPELAVVTKASGVAPSRAAMVVAGLVFAVAKILWMALGYGQLISYLAKPAAR